MENPKPSSRLASQRFVRIGCVALGIFLGSIVVSRIFSPIDAGFLEAFSWVPAGHLLEGLNPYAFGTTSPYSMTPYGVVFYSLIALGVELFGLQMWFGRMLSVFAFAIVCWAVLRITGAVTKTTSARWFAALAAFGLFPAEAWLGAMRPDLIALGFAFAALMLVIPLREDKPTGAAVLPAAILLSTAAFFTKQTCFLPIAIIVLRLLQLRRLRDAVIFSAAVCALIAGGVLLLDSTSGGGYTWQHFTHAERLPFSFGQMWQVAAPMLIAPTTIVLAVALLLFLYRNSVEGPRSAGLLMFVYLGLSLAIALVTSGRVGSNVNYYLETSFVAAIISGIIYDRLIEDRQLRMASALSILMVLGGVYQMTRIARGEYFRWQAVAYYREVADAASKHAAPGSPCISVFADLVMRTGCTLHFDDYGEYIGGWAPELEAAFQREVSEGRYDVIIWYTDRFADDFPNYRMVEMSNAPPERFFPVYLYVRR